MRNLISSVFIGTIGILLGFCSHYLYMCFYRVSTSRIETYKLNFDSIPGSNCPIQQTGKDPLLLKDNTYLSEIESYRLSFCVLPFRFSNGDSQSSLVSQDVVVTNNTVNSIPNNQFFLHHEESNRNQISNLPSNDNVSVSIDSIPSTSVDSSSHLPNTLESSLMVNEKESRNPDENDNTYGSQTHQRTYIRNDHPHDHISDEVYVKRATYIHKEEKKKLKSMKKKYRARVLNYHYFAMNMKFDKEVTPFSTYLYNMEPVDSGSKEQSLGLPDGEVTHVIVKKFKGNEEVSTIYTKDNRNYSFIHSFIAKYPLASDPFDVTCIFVMMLILSY